jgi:hypothetical protein
MLTKEIADIEKKIEKEFKMLKEGFGSHEARDRNIDLLRAKLSILKSAQQKFDKFVEDLKAELSDFNTREYCEKVIDELSSKQEVRNEN